MFYNYNVLFVCNFLINFLGMSEAGRMSRGC